MVSKSFVEAHLHRRPGDNRTFKIVIALERLTPAGYAYAEATGDVPEEIDGEDEQVDAKWAILECMLEGPDPATPAVAAQAIAGGRDLTERPWPGLFDGPRLITPDDAAIISAALLEVTDADIEHAFHTYDFTGRFGADGSRPSGLLKWYLWAFHNLRDFYVETAARGGAVVIMLV
jgi:Domain of unknown function (DUF1877)